MLTYAAQDLSNAALGGPIRIQDDRFIDGYGRTLSLRGLNVSGVSKLPTTPNGLSHLTEGFYGQHRTVSFIGRPFPLSEARLHFRRLKEWGLPLIRLLVTWESISHAGPNPNTDIDLEYIAYLKELISLMSEYGLKCVICAHQDVWSRFSGGSGAPGWTFEAAGLDIESFADTGAAYVHGQDELRTMKRKEDGDYDKIEAGGAFMWPSGYQKLAASTMASLFWAGDFLTPNLRCHRYGGKGKEKVGVQTFLQDAMIEAFGRLADEVGHLEAVLGFEPMNEPHRGLVNLHGFHGWNYDTDLHIGHCPSLSQSLALGSGYKQEVDYYVKSWPFPTRVSHKSVIDPKGRSAWLSHECREGKGEVDRPRGMGGCIWRAHGVWEWDEKKQKAVVLDDKYFDYDHRPGHEGREIEWYRDCYAPFLRCFNNRVSGLHPNHFSFIEPLPNEFMPPWPSFAHPPSDQLQKQKYATQTVIIEERPRNMVYSPHFYDLNVLFSKHHSWMSANVQGLSRGMFVLKGLYFGASGLLRNYTLQLQNILRHGRQSLGSIPTIIGEVGIPFDINNHFAFITGNYDIQRTLMNALISAMESNGLGFTLWNYNPDNCVEWGDGWNREDFSVVTSSTIPSAKPDYTNFAHEGDSLYHGGRVLDVIIRPYATKTAGRPIRSRWDARTLRYEFEWESFPFLNKSSEKSRITEIHIPNYHYTGHELNIISSNQKHAYDRELQTLRIWSEDSAPATTYKVVIEIRDLERHLIGRVRKSRAAFPAKFPRRIIPPIVEVLAFVGFWL